MKSRSGSGHRRARSRQTSHTAKLRRIRLFATDVDGVLTDGGMYYTDSGEQIKKFHVWDGMGLVLLKEAGVVTGIITAERTQVVAQRGAKLGISEVHQGVQDKLAALEDLAKRYDISLEEVAFIGEDINDQSALQAAGFSAAPANAREPIRKIVDYICKAKGGEGAVREVADLILAAQSSNPANK